MSVIDIKPDAQGKVRDLYDLGDKLLLVASDRISAFDYILEDEIPYKGQVLTQLSCFWFDLLSDVVDNHLISADVADLPEQFKPYADKLAGRFMLVKKANMFPVECIVRGYLTGSGLKDYQKTGAVCGIQLPEGLVNSSKLPETIFTPSTKAEIGDHDENISFERCAQIIGEADKSGRPRPNKADLPEVRIPADIIVVAIGQGIEIQGFEQAGVPIKRGTFVAGLSGQVGDMDNVFAGGDCVTGPASAIRAIAAGKVAAANIDEHLGFQHEIKVELDIPAPRLNNRAPHGRINTTEREACERRCDFEDIECGLTEEGARTEASRCLRCDHYGYGIFRGGRNEKW